MSVKVAALHLVAANPQVIKKRASIIGARFFI
ncbi:MAG: hypothetical protein RL271_540 [Actinomycetota bacterium]|jgi:hypothetical protein